MGLLSRGSSGHQMRCVGTRDGSLLRRASKRTHLPGFSLSLLRSLIKLGSRELPYDFYDCSLSCLILRLYFEEERGKVYLVRAVLRVHSQPRLHRTLWSWGVWYKCEPQTNNSFLTIRPPLAPKVGNPSSKTHGEPFTPFWFPSASQPAVPTASQANPSQTMSAPLAGEGEKNYPPCLELPEATMALPLKNTFLCSLLLNCSHTLPQSCSLYPTQI